jgi:glucosamine 6-phosphate synthetase-like amidotransferase/phosphosugar isomerase protein
VEWIQTQLGDAAKALAGELRNQRELAVVGGGFYYPLALEVAGMMRKLTHLPAEGKDAAVLLGDDLWAGPESSAAIFLSGSHCRVKKKVYAMLKDVKRARERAYAVTDGNDRELTRAAKLSILLPELSEMTGSILSLALMQWVAYHMTRNSAREENRPGAAPSADSAEA